MWGKSSGTLFSARLPAKRRLAFEKGERIGNQAMQAEVAQHQRTRTGVIDESAQGGGIRLVPAIHCSISQRWSGSWALFNSSSRCERMPSSGLFIRAPHPEPVERASSNFFVLSDSCAWNWNFSLLNSLSSWQTAKDFGLA